MTFSTLLILAVCRTCATLACVASVPVRAKCYVSRASEDSSRAKIGARAKKGKERGGGGPLPAPFPFLLSPQFSRDQNLYSRDTSLFVRTGTLATQASATNEPSKWPASPRASHSSLVRAHNCYLHGRPCVRFPSGTQIFSWSHARDK